MEPSTGVHHGGANNYDVRANDQVKKTTTTTSASTTNRSRTPSSIASVSPHLSGRLMELAEEQLLMERRLKAALQDAAKLRQRHLETLAPMLERMFFEKTGTWVLKEFFWEWYTYACQHRTECHIEKLQEQTRRQSLSFEADLRSLHKAYQELEMEKKIIQQRADQTEANLEVVRQEAIGYAGTADRLARQLAEAEKCILKLQNESQHIAEQVRLDIANYTSTSQQLIYRGDGYEQRVLTSPATPVGLQSFSMGAASVDPAEAAIAQDSAGKSPPVKESSGTPTTPHSAKLVSVDPSERVSTSIDKIKYIVVNVEQKVDELSQRASRLELSHASNSSFSSPVLHGIPGPFLHVPAIRPLQMAPIRQPVPHPLRIATPVPQYWQQQTPI